jgi:type I restriction enzyme S subunit
MKNKSESLDLKESNSKGRVPKLRFPEFRDAPVWEEKEVGEVFRVTRGEVLSMTLVKDNWTKETPYPVYSSQTKNNGLAGYYSDYLYENAITWTTDGANAGDVNYRPGKFYCTNVCGVLIETDGHANACIAAIINSTSKSHVSYVGNPKLMNGVMSKIRIPFPSIPEQQKIAACLCSLDELISAHAQKLATLKAHKQGLMQQLFPVEGETIPKLRFTEFQYAPEWEEKSLGEVITLEYGSSLSEQNRKGGTIPVIGSNGVVGYHDQYMVEGPAIVIGRKGSAGQVNWIISDCYPIDTAFYVKNKSPDDFLLPFLRFILEKSNLVRLKDNGAVPGLNRNEVYSIKSSFPNPQEQQKIADCLSSLNDLISAQTQKLNALKAHKKGLMQQLFPSADEVTG